MDSLSLQNPVFATYVIAATLMILKAPWTASVCRGISLGSDGRDGVTLADERASQQGTQTSA